MKLTIEKNVPIPGNAGKPPITVTLRAMQVGDSVFIAGRKAGDIGGFVYSYALRKDGFRFTARTIVENGVKGVRLWRVAA